MSESVALEQRAEAQDTKADKPGIRVAAGVHKGEAAPAKYRLRTVHDVLTPMRDGVLLAMELLRPDPPGAFPRNIRGQLAVLHGDYAEEG